MINPTRLLLRTIKRLGFYLSVSLIFMIIMVVGFTIFYHYAEEDLGWLDSFYFTIITTRTIGFGDISPQTVAGKLGTIVNALLPATVFLGASLLVIESAFRSAEAYWKTHLMRRHHDHTIVIADMQTLPEVVAECVASEEDFVVIHPETMANLPERMLDTVDDSVYLQGDPTEDAILIRAQVKEAARMLIALDDDRRSMFVLVTAKGLNPAIQVTVRVNREENVGKFSAVGADHVLPTSRVLGRMLTTAAARPIAHQFLLNLHTRTEDPFIEEVTPDSASIGKPVRAAFPRAVALFRNNHYLYDIAEHTIQEGDVVLCIWLKFHV